MIKVITEFTYQILGCAHRKGAERRLREVMVWGWMEVSLKDMTTKLRI